MDQIRGVPLRQGPEADFVFEFISSALPRPLPNENRTVLIEPRLGLSRPDIVVVYWDGCVAALWPEARRHLTHMDLRLAHHLHLSGQASEAQLAAPFPRRLPQSLERLEAAGVARCVAGRWRLKDVHRIFAVSRIIAFEAKLSSVARAIAQAFLNTWFASESYVLTPVRRPKAETVERARSRGVGLWLAPWRAALAPFVPAVKKEIPASYASWQLNEMAWREDLGSVNER